MFGLFSGSREWVYAQSVQGRFQRLHRLSGFALLAFLVVIPWLSWGDQPLFRMDVPARKVYAFGAIFTTADGFILALTGFFAAFSLFFFTSLFGRLWCGYACPQTVFLEEFIRPIEALIEGDRGVRMARDKKGWTFDKAWRFVAKQLAFLAVAVFVSGSFMGWFVDVRDVWTASASTTTYAITAFFAGIWYFDFAWFREQMCNLVCPYARFQGALCDDESLVVTYDVAHAEPRGGKDAKEEGRCIDCKKCVTVCPQGIDIRDGFQLECVTCGRCIDACEGVMGKLGKPSLVVYSTVAEQEGRQARWIRPRTVVYMGLLTAIAAGILGLITLHSPIEAHVARAPGSLYTLDNDGFVRNTYIVDIVNRDGDADADTFTITVTGLEGAEVLAAPLKLAAAESRTVPVVVRVPANQSVSRTVPLLFHVHVGEYEVTRNATFKTPGAPTATGEHTAPAVGG